MFNSPLFVVILMSIIALLLLLLTLSRRAGYLKMLLGVLTAAVSVASLVLFVLMQRGAGRPQAGQELMQLYIPCGIYAVLALAGFLASALSRRKIQKDKILKAAVKAVKAQEHEREPEAPAPQKTENDA